MLSNALNGEAGIAAEVATAGSEFDDSKMNKTELEALIYQFAEFIIGQQKANESHADLTISSLIDEGSYAEMVKMREY